jgi:FAD synthase
MNPPTKGHQKLVTKMREVAKEYGAEPRLYLSHTQDKKHNPLTYDQKICLARDAFGDIVKVSKINNIIGILESLVAEFDAVHIVVGKDQYDSMHDMLMRESVEKIISGKIFYLHSAGERTDIVSENVESISATRVREAARANDFDTVRKLMPDSISDVAIRNTIKSINTSVK